MPPPRAGIDAVLVSGFGPADAWLKVGSPNTNQPSQHMDGSVHKTHVRRPRSTNPHQHKQAMDEQRVSRLARQGTARTENRNGMAVHVHVCVCTCACVCVRVHRCITDAPVLSASDVVPRWNVWFRHWSWGTGETPSSVSLETTTQPKQREFPSPSRRTDAVGASPTLRVHRTTIHTGKLSQTQQTPTHPAAPCRTPSRSNTSCCEGKLKQGKSSVTKFRHQIWQAS